MKSTLVIALALLAPAWPSLAQTHHHEHAATPAPTAAPGATHTASATPAPASGLPVVDAEVRRVDMGTGKVTLKHGDIPNLDMPPMTMVFQVQDPALLRPFKPGDKVRFTAEKIKGAYTVIELSAAP